MPLRDYDLNPLGQSVADHVIETVYDLVTAGQPGAPPNVQNPQMQGMIEGWLDNRGFFANLRLNGLGTNPPS